MYAWIINSNIYKIRGEKMEKKTKKELKFVFSPEIYDELKYAFRPDQLENVIYKPELKDEKVWQCCCGSESELEICPICGMEKHTVFSKVNANYLARHRKARIARRKKAAESKKTMMASQMLQKNNKKKTSDSKKGTLIGILFLCIAIIICFVIIFTTEKQEPAPIDSSTSSYADNTTEPISSETDDQSDSGTGDDESSNEPPTDTSTPDTTDTTPPETTTTPPDSTEPNEPLSVPTVEANDSVATVEDGKWPAGASGNTAMGGLFFSGKEYDYIAKDGITILDKNGNTTAVLSNNKALFLTGNDSYIFYIDENSNIHKIDLKTSQDTNFSVKSKYMTVCFDELYYTGEDGKGLYACDFDGVKTKILTNLEIFALNATADKLYFSTSKSLCVVSSKDANVVSFCKDGAKATSVIEITGCVFYTSGGKLKFHNPNRPAGYSVEYPLYNVNITAVTAYENRVYVRAESYDGTSVMWHSTVWTPGTKLFNTASFTKTGVTTLSLYVTNNAVYDGQLNRQ